VELRRLDAGEGEAALAREFSVDRATVKRYMTREMKREGKGNEERDSEIDALRLRESKDSRAWSLRGDTRLSGKMRNASAACVKVVLERDGESVERPGRASQ
jgi:hypothetical protein